MEYSTQYMILDLQILQSVLYNAEQDIPKLKISIEFEDRDKYNRFITRANPISNQDNQIIDSDSLSEEEYQNNQQEQLNDKIPSHQEIESKDDEEIRLVDKLTNLEESIILKQEYMESINKIAKKTGTRVLIVPEKIKYFGRSYEDIEQAKGQVHDIRNNIVHHKISKFGNQIYQSKFYSNLIHRAKIHLIKIGQKYLSWYDQTKIKVVEKDQILSDTFNSKYHCMYSLFYSSTNTYKRFNDKYITALIKTKGHLFTKYLEQSLNQSYQPQFWIQLSKSQNDLIIHCNVQEQSNMRICQIRSLYENFLYFFISYDYEDDQEDEQTRSIPNIQKIEKYLLQKDILFYRHEHLLVIAYQKQYTRRFNETIVNQTMMVEKNKKDFLDNIKAIFDMNLQCKIQVLVDDEYGIDTTGQQLTPQQQKINKQITMEDKIPDRLRVISPKNKKSSIFIQILEYYILIPLLTSKSKKKSKDPILNQSVNQSEIPMDSQIINDTTTQLLERDSFLKDDGQNKDKTFTLPTQLTKMCKKLSKSSLLQKYTYKIEDKLGANKYSKDAKDKLNKVKTKIDTQLSEQLKYLIGIKYKIMDVSIKQQYLSNYNKLREYGNIVTVFVRQKDQKCLYDSNDRDCNNNNKQKVEGTQNNDVIEIPIYLVERSKNIENNGWLINVDKSMIIERDYMLFISNRDIADKKQQSQQQSLILKQQDLIINKDIYYETIKYLKYIKSS